ncbi:MAG: ACT domain-containing protein [Angelakisella sp.]
MHNEALDDKVITLSARLEDRPGVLSGLLNSLSEQQGNILTVNQNIPVDGVAAVSVSARLPLPMAIETLRQNLLSLPGVTQVDILSTR